MCKIKYPWLPCSRWYERSLFCPAVLKRCRMRKVCNVADAHLFVLWLDVGRAAEVRRDAVSDIGNYHQHPSSGRNFFFISNQALIITYPTLPLPEFLWAIFYFCWENSSSYIKKHFHTGQFSPSCISVWSLVFPFCSTKAGSRPSFQKGWFTMFANLTWEGNS